MAEALAPLAGALTGLGASAILRWVFWAVSSVGERFLDTEEVRSSILLPPTMWNIRKKAPIRSAPFRYDAQPKISPLGRRALTAAQESEPP